MNEILEESAMLIRCSIMPDRWCLERAARQHSNGCKADSGSLLGMNQLSLDALGLALLAAPNQLKLDGSASRI